MNKQRENRKKDREENKKNGSRNKEKDWEKRKMNKIRGDNMKINNKKS